MTRSTYRVEIERLVITGITGLPADPDTLPAILARELQHTLAARLLGAELAGGGTVHIELPALSFADPGGERSAVAAIADGVARALVVTPTAAAGTPSTGGPDRG